MFGISREQIAEATLTNLVQVGALKPEEVEPGRELLDGFSDEALVRLLLLSHQAREVLTELDQQVVMPFYIITEINLN